MVLPKIAIASINVGRAAGGHSIETKIKAAANAGFDGLELAFECLDLHSQALSPNATPYDALRAGAKDVRGLADQYGIEVMALQPFMRYDAVKEWQERFEDGKLWIELCGVLGAKILQIPTCTYPVLPSQIDPTPSHLAENIARLADAAAPHGIQLAYEAPAWGMAMDTWQEVDNVIKLANRPNVGHCLDTFHIAAVVAGDVTSPSTSYLKPDAAPLLKASLDELTTTIKPNEIVYFQLSDANAVDLSQKAYPVKDLDQPDLMTWSRNCRIYPCEEGAVLLSVDVCKAVFATGYKGWVSMEVFHADLYSKDPSVPDEWAKRGMDSWKKVVELCGLK
ncbi:hypothetical protein MNV49_004509 [Pseudohyphozyma bogoriensis]|nr:hypothetical protein MNV49_004509 [Pseudohyphozyma bogoriensis]